MKLTIHKSRFIQEGKNVVINIDFENGMDRYSGLVDAAQKLGVIEKSGNNYIIDGTEVKMKAVKKNPEKYISSELLKKIGKAIKGDFSFGKSDEEIEGV